MTPRNSRYGFCPQCGSNLALVDRFYAEFVCPCCDDRFGEEAPYPIPTYSQPGVAETLVDRLDLPAYVQMTRKGTSAHWALAVTADMARAERKERRRERRKAGWSTEEIHQAEEKESNRLYADLLFGNPRAPKVRWSS